MKSATAHARLLCALIATFAAASAWAERADKEKPVNLDADKVTIDDKNKVHVFEGNVRLSQGTLLILGDKIVVTQDAAGFQKGVATGRLAKFRQKREGKDEYVDGEADRIEHDNRTEHTRFFGNAYVKSGQDDVRGQYIEYDALTEQYLVTSGPDGTVLKSTPQKDSRVHAVIQPRNKDNASSTPAPTAPVTPPKAAPRIQSTPGGAKQ